MGWLGRGGASDARDPEMERTWPVVNGALFDPDSEFDRFIAEAG